MRKVLCLCAYLISVSAAADVYRWVDSEGKTHYGDRAPAEQGNQAARVPIKTGSAGVDPEAEKAREQIRAMDEGRQRERTLEAESAAQKQKQQAQSAQRCRTLQNKIRDDKNVAVFYRYDEAGNRVLWSSEERLAYRAQLQQQKQTYCPDLPD